MCVCMVFVLETCGVGCVEEKLALECNKIMKWIKMIINIGNSLNGTKIKCGKHEFYIKCLK